MRSSVPIIRIELVVILAICLCLHTVVETSGDTPPPPYPLRYGNFVEVQVLSFKMS